MQSVAQWWARRPRASAAGLVAAAVVLAATAASLGGVAVVRLPTPGTTCNAAATSANVFPALVGVGGASSPPSASGTVIRANGVILTSRASLPAGGTVSVTLSDGERVSAAVIGMDVETSLAVLKIDRQRLPFRLPAPREPVTAGLPVVVLGSPLIADSAVHAGTVQSVNATVDVAGQPSWRLAGATITDIPNSEGNLGGPMVTCDYQMLGVVVGRLGPSGSAVIVPSDAAQRVVNRLLGLN